MSRQLRLLLKLLLNNRPISIIFPNNNRNCCMESSPCGSSSFQPVNIP